MDAWEKFKKLKVLLGADELAESLARAIGTDKLDEYCDYIARMNDIEL